MHGCHWPLSPIPASGEPHLINCTAYSLARSDFKTQDALIQVLTVSIYELYDLGQVSYSQCHFLNESHVLSVP